MTYENEAGRVARPAPASEMSFSGDFSEIASHPLVINRLARRLGISAELAAVVAELAALGSKEARQC